MTAGLDQLLAILWDRSSWVAQLRDAAAQAREAVTEIDAESETAPSREAATLARMMSPGGPSTVYVLEELRKLEDEASARMLQRKVAVALAAQLDGRVREVEAREAARDPAEVRREQEKARREAEKEALFAKVPVLFRTDFVVSKLGAAAYSRTPPPQGSHVSYVRNFTVPRVLENLMAATKVQGWPPRHGDFARIEWQNSEIEEDEKIAAPLRLLAEKSSCSDAEVTLAIDRAQAALLNEFGRVCAEIRAHYHGELPRFIALPSFIAPRALAAE